MAFLSSLTEVHSLKEKVKFLARWTEKFPGLEGGLALIAPLLLLMLNEGALPYILEIFSTWEGHIGKPTLESAVFVKLSVFVVSLVVMEVPCVVSSPLSLPRLPL